MNGVYFYFVFLLATIGTLKEPMQETSIFFFPTPSRTCHIIQNELCSGKENFNPFQNKPWFLRICSASLLKTLSEKKKLLKTSNFSFSYSVFYLSGKFSDIFINFENAVCKLLSLEESKIYHLGKGRCISIVDYF